MTEADIESGACPNCTLDKITGFASYMQGLGYDTTEKESRIFVSKAWTLMRLEAITDKKGLLLQSKISHKGIVWIVGLLFGIILPGLYYFWKKDSRLNQLRTDVMNWQTIKRHN